MNDSKQKPSQIFYIIIDDLFQYNRFSMMRLYMFAYLFVMISLIRIHSYRTNKKFFFWI